MSEENPNFTVITNGGCAAKCSFCTDSYTRKASKQYLENLEKALSPDGALPYNFIQCSISGGEPTTSPNLQEILEIITESRRFRKVVLTTNGAKLDEHKELIAKHISHLNISRHGIGDAVNEQVFQTKHFIKDAQLKDVCSYFNRMGIDVNFNYVYTKDKMLTKPEVIAYVEYAKSMGANSVSLRYDQNENSLTPTPVEQEFSDYKIVYSGGCPVCRNHTVLVNGLQTVFKASFAEPSNTINGVYELIYGIDGKLTTDWEAKNEFTRADMAKYNKSRLMKEITERIMAEYTEALEESED